ncbi:glycosyltransferase family 61 protein [Pedobacter arcticus]|uniref:glycosyltransferase family 61 protein n=1 Tax=Pedobacter arcticus TaxID=752140 RepID=UPI0002E7D65C|nr:glycosyltransferase family 61 protein [Pedobacter arcticus]
MKIDVLSNEYISIRALPINYKESDSKIFKREFKKLIPQNNVSILKNATIVEETIFHNYCILGNYTHTFKLDWQYKSKVILKRFIFPQLKVEKAIWITDDLSPGYFHWFLDCLPRLLNIDKTDSDKNGVIILTPETVGQNFVTDSLDLMGYKYFVKTDKKVNIKCEELLVGNHCAYTTGNYNEPLIKELRDIFLKKIKVQKSSTKKWVYISRDKSTRRKATNEAGLVNMLLALNVEVHYFEEYSFLKQMDIIAHTDYLISIHGASLTNMLFMSENTHVIELRNDVDTHSNCYFSLAAALDINYHYLLNKGNDDIPHFANLIIDIEALKNYILNLRKD